VILGAVGVATAVESARWDWWEVTLHQCRPELVVEVLGRSFDLSTVVPAKPHHGYLRAAGLARGADPLCVIEWAGNPGVHVKASGDRSPALAEVLQREAREWGWTVNATRVDACIDWIEPGLFDALAGAFIEFAVGRSLSIDQQGDWQRSRGRTLYVGSKASTVYLALYEKGYEAGGALEWVRWEVRVRPRGSEKREEVARWRPADAFGASAWHAELARVVGLGELVKRSVGTVWRPSDTDRVRAALVRQYGKILRAWRDEVGDWDSVGRHVGVLVDDGIAKRISNGVHAPEGERGHHESSALARLLESIERSGATLTHDVYTSGGVPLPHEVSYADDEAKNRGDAGSESLRDD
jgi:hypothetical protein